MTTKARRHRGRAQRHINRGTTPTPGTPVHHHYQMNQNPFYALNHTLDKAILQPIEILTRELINLFRTPNPTPQPTQLIHNGKTNRQ